MDSTLDSQSGTDQKVMSVNDWILTTLIAAIPIVGFIMLFVWGFGSDTNPNKANWAKAVLIWIAIFIALNILAMVFFGAAFFSSFSQM